jgi:hypothetical protein
MTGQWAGRPSAVAAARRGGRGGGRACCVAPPGGAARSSSSRGTGQSKRRAHHCRCSLAALLSRPPQLAGAASLLSVLATAGRASMADESHLQVVACFCCCSVGWHAAGFCVVSPSMCLSLSLLSASLSAVLAFRLAQALQQSLRRQLPCRVLASAVVLDLLRYSCSGASERRQAAISSSNSLLCCFFRRRLNRQGCCSGMTG